MADKECHDEVMVGRRKDESRAGDCDDMVDRVAKGGHCNDDALADGLVGNQGAVGHVSLAVGTGDMEHIDREGVDDGQDTERVSHTGNEGSFQECEGNCLRSHTLLLVGSVADPNSLVEVSFEMASVSQHLQPRSVAGDRKTALCPNQMNRCWYFECSPGLTQQRDPAFSSSWCN